MDWTWQATVHGVSESDVTEQLSAHPCIQLALAQQALNVSLLLGREGVRGQQGDFSPEEKLLVKIRGADGCTIR